MSKNVKYRNSFFKFLQFSRFLASNPSYDTLRRKLNHVYAWRVYHFIYASINVYIYYLAYLHPRFPKSHYSDYFLETMSAFIIKVCYTITMLGVIFTSTRGYEEMFVHIKRIEDELKPYYKLSERLGKSSIYMRYFLKFSLIALLAIFEAIIPFEINFLWLGLHAIPVLQVTVLMVIIDDVALIVHEDFRLLNKILIRDYLRNKLPKNRQPIDFNKVTRIYMGLYKTIDLFNEIFGWEIVLVNILAVISSLPALERIISWELKNYKAVPEMVLSFWKISHCVIITRTCHQAKKEGEKFAATLFRVSNAMPDTASDYELRRDDLKFLRETYAEFRPEFSAAGVFAVDHSIYYSLFTLVMSYFAIFMQLKYPT